MTDSSFGTNFGQKPQANTQAKKPEAVVIKKYANRRLYNTASSSYVTLETLAEMIRDEIEFIVVDAKTGEELTRPVLTQIIVEQESKGEANGQTLLPISFLRQLIALYGGNMQSVVPNYLDQMMQSFVQNQSQLQDYMQQALEKNPFTAHPLTAHMGNQMTDTVSQIQKQQTAMMEQAMKFFMPFAPQSDAGTREKAATLDALRQKVASLEEELKGME